MGSAPVLSPVTATSVTSEGVTVTWTTNEAADTQVEYGLTTGYGKDQPCLNTNLVTSHSQALSGLAAATAYHFRVKPRDASGNLATSGDFTFTTLPIDLSTGLAAHWDFDEGAGTTANDASGNGRPGTLMNGPSWTAGRVDGGLTFDGTASYTSAAHTSAFNAYPLTVAAGSRPVRPQA